MEVNLSGDIKIGGDGMANSYTLRLILSSHSLIYTVSDPAGKLMSFQKLNFEQFNSIESFDEQLSAVFRKNEVFKATFSEIKLIWNNKVFTLIDKGQSLALNSLLEFNFGELPYGKTFTTSLGYAVLGYSMPALVHDTITTYLKDVQILHYVEVLHRVKTEDQIVLAVNKDFFFLFIQKKGNLLLANTYPLSSTEDFLYYVINACQQVRLDAGQQKFLLVGEVENSSALYEILNKYSEDVSFIEGDKLVYSSTEFNALPPHFFFPLLQPSLCE